MAKSTTDEDHITICRMLDGQIDKLTSDYLDHFRAMVTTYKEEFLALNRSVVLLVTDSGKLGSENQFVVGKLVLGRSSAVLPLLETMITELKEEAGVSDSE